MKRRAISVMGWLSHRTGKCGKLAKLKWLREPKIFILPLKIF
jgi:hypothetical protein